MSKSKRKPSNCQHLRGWTFKRLPDGSVKRTCKGPCKKSIVMVAQGHFGTPSGPMKGNYSAKRKRNQADQ
jgi:hypothetical protein